MSRLLRRHALRRLGASVLSLPFLGSLPSLRADSPAAPRPRRVIFWFTPNGTVPDAFWPAAAADQSLTLTPILAPLQPWQDRLLVLKGVSNKVRGDGDSHMRGMSCLLTGIELFPGNIQGGSHTPAGWASGISIDQELRRFFQSDAATRTRIGSLELGVAVPDRADPWTRWSYAGPNQPMTPLDDPARVLRHLYGHLRDRETLTSVLDGVAAELRTAASRLPAEDRTLLDRHLTLVRETERSLQQTETAALRHAPPAVPDAAPSGNDAIPDTMRLQTDLLVNAMANDLVRVATFQFTNSVGGARMSWLDIKEGHHQLSHDPDLNKDSHDKLVRINTWLASQLAALVRALAETPEPRGDGSLLDHTTIVWANELGKGNSHTLDNLPFVLVGGGHGFRTGRCLTFDNVAHNRLWLALAHASGHHLPHFGNPALCEGGPLDLA